MKQPEHARKGGFSFLPALAILIAGTLPVFGTANYVYHERTGTDPGCGGQYVTRLNPTSAETYPLRFKVEYQFYINTGAVYYTTDGSVPIGAFGSPSNTTQVVPANFACTFGGGPVVDVWQATIPAQAAGTVVRYIISAWHTDGGDEVFANSGACCAPYASLSGQATNFQYTVGSTTDLYWDINGATAGAGGATPGGTWDGAAANWSTVFDGTAATGLWTAGRNAVFSAGTDASGAFTVTVSGTQTAGGIIFEEGTVSIASGTVAVGGGNVTVNSGATVSTDNSTRITSTAGSTLNINGGTWRTAHTGNAGTFFDVDFNVTIGPNGATFSQTSFNTNTIIQDNSAPAVVRISGPGGITKTGVGVLSIAPATTYAGPTIINEGELRIRTTPDRLPITTPVTVNSPGILNLNAVNQQIGSLSGNGDVGLGSGRLTVGDSSNTVFSGGIKDTANYFAGASATTGGRVVKVGSGSLTFLGTNTFTGSLTNNAGTINVSLGAFLCGSVCDVVVNAGTLNLSNVAQSVLSISGTGGVINLAPGHSLTVSNAAAKTYSGVIAGSGNLIKTNTGNLTLAGANTYEGTTLVSSGRLSVASATALGSSSIGTEVISGAELLFDGAANNFTISEPLRVAGIGAGDGGVITIQNSANITINGPVTLAGDSQITVSGTGTGLYNHPNSITSLADQNLTLQGGAGAGGGGTISGVINLGAGGLTKLQGGRWTLSGANVYSGPTTISAGTLRVANTTGSATGSGAVTVAAGATLSGSGTIAGSVSVTGTISAGVSPGTINTGNETWNGGGTYLWEINDVDAGAGTDPGWDLVNITGGLTITATPASKFTIKITSLSLANAAGDVHDFNNTTDYIWTIARTTAGISGFDAAAFNLDTASFSNALGSGLFLIETANGGNDIVLRFVSRPAITLQPVGGSAECTSNFTFAVTATGSAPLSYQWKHAGTNLPVASSAMLTVAASAGTAGNYSVEVSNAYGTTNSDSAALVVVDTTPPTITCPSNQVASVPPGQTNAVVNYPSPEATDSCSSVTTACVPASGSTFAGGTTTVTCTATDGSSNVATCTFTVTVSIGLAAGNDTIGAVANHSASVSAAKLLANDSSGGGNTLSISAVSSSSTNGGTVALSAGVVTYTPVAIFTGTDAFTYTLEDNQGGTATGTVIVLVRPANNASLNQISATTTQNGVLVRFAGIPGRTYNIERSLDSMTWSVLGSATAQPNGVIGFEDTNPPAGPAFYRTVVP